jgi:hypothetical protein
MVNHRWNYDGDINLEYGGLFWRKTGFDDYVDVVEISPCTDQGGPNNLFIITRGSIYLPKDRDARKSALNIIGVDMADAKLRDLVHAFNAYHGVERDSLGGEHIVRIGKPDEFWSGRGYNPKPHEVLRADAKLVNYVRKGFL